MNKERPYRLLAPGPVPVPSAVLKAMGEKVLHHRTPEFIKILEGTWARLKFIFHTRQPVQIITGTGSAAMEAAVVNTLSPGDEALVVVSGKFGERWAEMCERYGIKTHRWNLEWGTAAPIAEFTAELKKHPYLKAVFSQACETSTATVHPIKDMAKAIRATVPNALFAVDAITAIGCMPLPMDEWDLDVVVAGSQKAFMIPTGLSFIALSERAWKAQAQSKIAKFYLDLAGERKANAKGDSQFSIPTPLIVGLNIVLERIEKLGFERFYKRCYVLSEATRVCGDMLGMHVFSNAPSPSVTALVTESDSAKIRDWLEQERGITIMGGQDQLKGKILRIGHMGDVRNEDMIALFDALSEYLKKPNVREELERQLKQAEPLFA
jgi:aspartate aminotransferase-like enzyme